MVDAGSRPTMTTGTAGARVHPAVSPQEIATIQALPSVVSGRLVSSG